MTRSEPQYYDFCKISASSPWWRLCVCECLCMMSVQTRFCLWGGSRNWIANYLQLSISIVPPLSSSFKKVSAESYWTDWNSYEIAVRAQHFVVIGLWTAALLHYEWASDCVLKWLAWDNDKLIIGPWRFKSLWKSYKSWEKILLIHFCWDTWPKILKRYAHLE